MRFVKHTLTLLLACLLISVSTGCVSEDPSSGSREIFGYTITDEDAAADNTSGAPEHISADADSSVTVTPAVTRLSGPAPDPAPSQEEQQTASPGENNFTEPDDNIYTVTFNLNGGKLAGGKTEQRILEGSAASAPLAVNGSMILSWDTDFSCITADTVVNAVWTANVYTVTFDLNGGTLVSGETRQKIEDGSAASAPLAVNGTKTLSWDTDFSRITADTVVNAVWTANVHTVTFDPACDSLAPVTVEVEDGCAANAPDFQVSGMNLSWDRSFDNVTGDMTVTAQWTRNTMSSTEISAYADTRVATLYVHNQYGTDLSGTGFFIDNRGTFVTNYSLIEFADSMSLKLNDGAVHNVSRIINFSEKYDLAVLQIDITGNDYFTICTSVEKGEKVYAVGSALGNLEGTITSGIVSSPSRMMGSIDCIQIDAPLSEGNGGGPLINEYGEVIGVNAFSLSDGYNLNFAVNIAQIKKLPDARDFTINDYVEWWRHEVERSYRPTDSTNMSYFSYSIVNTYTQVTNVECSLSSNKLTNDADDYVEDYDSNYLYYIYSYSSAKYDKYVQYLKSLGFEYDIDSSGNYDDGIMSCYYNAASKITISLYITNERSVLGTEALIISVIN